MMKHVYRFRPIDRLLDKGELENQQIYFADPQELNDPIEGFRDIVWQGDAVLWSNLVRHYVLCLERAAVLLVVGGEGEPIKWSHLPLVTSRDVSFTPMHASKQKEILNLVLDPPDMQRLIAALSQRTIPVYRQELIAILEGIHLNILTPIHKAYDMRGETLKASILDDALRRVCSIAEAVIQVEQSDDAASVIPALFESQNHLSMQLSFNRVYQALINPEQPNRNFVFLSFPHEYVQQIEALVHPPWYAACFMSDCVNPSIWGTYGHGHTGVCLRFKTSDVAGQPSMRLYRQNGSSSSSGVISGWVEHQFHPIIYDEEPPPVSFFSMLGRISRAAIERDWYTDHHGNRSSLSHGGLSDEKRWQDDYWSDFMTGITTKLADWRHENELRLLLVPSILDFSTPTSRTARYDFADLDGIIFGIRTPIEKKVAICRLIEEKCRAANRSDFSFFQAYHSPRTGLIERAEMSLLQMREPPVHLP